MVDLESSKKERTFLPKVSSIFVCLYFIFYNIPLFQQIVAHEMYQRVDLQRESLQRIRCMSVSYIGPPPRPWTNHAREYEHDGWRIHSYMVDGKKYFIQRYSYLESGNGCASDKIISGFYFPLLPSANLISNEWPADDYWMNFKISLLLLIIALTGVNHRMVIALLKAGYIRAKAIKIF